MTPPPTSLSSSSSASSSPKHEDLVSITNSTDGDQIPLSWHAGSFSSAGSQPRSTVTATERNPLPHLLPEGDNAAPLEVMGSTASDKLVIVMVGLPATGKTHIAKRICRFLSFFHDIPSQIFNVGDYRRQLCGAQLPASFYSSTNVDGVAQRKVACDAALADLMEYMRQDGVRVAALDATNSTKKRRMHIVSTLKKEKNNIKCIFIESICDDEAILRENIHKVKLSTPDYKGIEEKDAVDDFLARRANYDKNYEPVDDEDGVSYCKIVNSHKYIVHNIRGYLSLKIVHFVMNLHTLPRTFYFTRHGQSEYNLLGKIGGDSGLTPAGLEYARRLAHFAKEEIARPRRKDTKKRSNSHDFFNNDSDDDDEKDDDKVVEDNEERPCRLWTSTMRRTQETAQFISHKKFNHTFDNGESFDWSQFRPKPRRNLDELYAGTCDGMTYKEIQDTYPDEFARRQADKLSYRYPRGESYMDVTLRLEPLAQEMERIREPLLIVGHQGILRILYAYFMGLDRKEAPYVSIPLNNVIELTPHAYGCHEKRYCLMMKEEMLVDGQDEPITSMPMAKRGLMAPGLYDVNGNGGSANNNNNNNGDANSHNNGDANNNSHVSPNAIPSSKTLTHSGSSVREIDAEYSKDDPIMNAPGC